MSAPPLGEIQQLVERVVASEGMELIDFEFKAGRSRNLLRVFIDKAGGVTLEDCENISRQLGALLDVKDLIKNAYVLEISSPGLDRPLRTDRDYQRALGKVLRVNFTDEKGGYQQATGRLLETTDERIILEADGVMITISRDYVTRAVQDIQMAHPKKDLKKRK